MLSPLNHYRYLVVWVPLRKTFKLVTNPKTTLAHACLTLKFLEMSLANYSKKASVLVQKELLDLTKSFGKLSRHRRLIDVPFTRYYSAHNTIAYVPAIWAEICIDCWATRAKSYRDPTFVPWELWVVRVTQVSPMFEIECKRFWFSIEFLWYY